MKVTTVDITDANGVKQKTPIVTSFTMENGKPVFQAFTMDGRPVTDSKVINQAIMGGDEGSNSGLGGELASVRKAFESGHMDYDTYKRTVDNIQKAYRAKNAEPKQGENLNPAANKKQNKAINTENTDNTEPRRGYTSYGPKENKSAKIDQLQKELSLVNKEIEDRQGEGSRVGKGAIPSKLNRAIIRRKELEKELSDLGQ